MAIVSRDADFRTACKFYAELFHYPSLPAITEAFLSGDTRIEKIRPLLSKAKKMLEDAVAEDFTSLDFVIEEDPHGDVNEVQVESVSIDDLRIINLGSKECSAAFSAGVDFWADVRYDDPDSDTNYDPEDRYVPPRSIRGAVSDWAEISGTAKLHVSERVP